MRGIRQLLNMYSGAEVEHVNAGVYIFRYLDASGVYVYKGYAVVWEWEHFVRDFKFLVRPITSITVEEAREYVKFLALPAVDYEFVRLVHDPDGVDIYYKDSDGGLCCLSIDVLGMLMYADQSLHGEGGPMNEKCFDLQKLSWFIEKGFDVLGLIEEGLGKVREDNYE